MYIDDSLIFAEVYHEIPVQEMYLVKVGFPDIGFYIGSMTVRPSPRYPEKGLWVQPPKYQTNGKWISPLEFTKESPLWRLIESAARLAVDQYLLKNTRDALPNDEDIKDLEKKLDDAFGIGPP